MGKQLRNLTKVVAKNKGTENSTEIRELLFLVYVTQINAKTAEATQEPSPTSDSALLVTKTVSATDVIYIA